MKKLILLFIIFIYIFLFAPPPPKPAFGESKYYYTYNVEHLFTHCLIAYPEIAFAPNNSMQKHYNADCITTGEFFNILQSLYNNNYDLVNINECFEVIDGIAIKKKIKMPINKKALILSFDDVVYDSKKMGMGMVDKIILDQNGNIATSTNLGTKTEISYNNEFVTILESFISIHPDFSIRGARGTINLTGYDGILGYRTNHKNPNHKKEAKQAQKVIDKLKMLGWTFASHSYGHYHMKKLSTSQFLDELNLWKNEVEPLVGKTMIYVYPYGEWEVFDGGHISEKHKLLNKFGFKLFLGVGMKTFYSYLPSKNNKVLFMDRKCIDGNTLRANSKELSRFFNPLTILDKNRPNNQNHV